MRNYYPCETHKSAEFCEMMNNFFDISNVRNSVEGIKSKNSFLKPFTMILMKNLNGYITLSFHISQTGNYRLRTENTLANMKKEKC